MRQPAAPTQLTRLEAHRNFTTSLCAGFHTRGSSQQETYSQRFYCHKIAIYCTTSPINISSSLFPKLCLAGESHGLLGEATSSPPCGPKNGEPSTGAHPLSGRGGLKSPRLFGTCMPMRHLLALVSDSSAYMDATSFTKLSDTTQIIALTSVSSVSCGHFLCGTNSRRWAIIDHSCELVRPIFSVDNDDYSNIATSHYPHT
ncbi:uncharacterized protein EI90DRAFT_451142 [Cantharellus anzutake]|uniref:uncharacterized protein n=1 Tax=Cantharellus anzutake TaxID=1750568 RepID=UPI001905CD01|nr:uncharacterized protein EI90DRAFT_451142 [Cantharellus anzutake]KAF8334672.1 hypothetical protein EI90DRAFT_451142 [Cantharellus anzutake]